MTITTTAMPVDLLVVGVRFIPKGKKHPVRVVALSEFHAATIDVYAESPRGFSAHILNRYDTVDVVAAQRDRS